MEDMDRKGNPIIPEGVYSTDVEHDAVQGMASSQEEDLDPEIAKVIEDDMEKGNVDLEKDVHGEDEKDESNSAQVLN